LELWPSDFTYFKLNKLNPEILTELFGSTFPNIHKMQIKAIIKIKGFKKIYFKFSSLWSFL